MPTTYTNRLGQSKILQGEEQDNWDDLQRQDADRLEERLSTQYAGNPNGNVAGYWVGQFCYDTTNGRPYICTAATAVAATSVWVSLAIVIGALIRLTEAKSANYTALAADSSKIFLCTGTFTLALTVAATLGNGWNVGIVNEGSGDITIDPNGSETVDGAVTLVVKPGESLELICNGILFKTTGLNVLEIRKSLAAQSGIAASVSSSQNDWAPTGIADASAIRISATGTFNITGISGGRTGRLLFLINGGTNKVIFKHEDVASLAANRFNLSARDAVLSPGAILAALYDAVSSRWRLMGEHAAGMPRFSARIMAAQSISHATDTVVNYDTEEEDSHGAYDAGTSRFTPQVAGTYLFGAFLQIDSLVNNKSMTITVRKNGLDYKAMKIVNGDSAAANTGIEIVGIIQMNGSTDYMDVVVSHQHGSARNTISTPTTNQFWANYVGPTI